MINNNIKAIGFDVGHTLVHYKNPLNWKDAYPNALMQVAAACGFRDAPLQPAIDVLLRYNTREFPRTDEVSADVIFGEILDQWQANSCCLSCAKKAFFSYFQNGSIVYPDVEATLGALQHKSLKLGALTDVAYGMDKEYALQDIAEIAIYFDVIYTSVDIGFRKPHPAGYLLLCKSLCVRPHELIYVGDEQKDIIGANEAGCISVLINRTGKDVDYGQAYTIRHISEISTLAKIKSS